MHHRGPRHQHVHAVRGLPVQLHAEPRRRARLRMRRHVHRDHHARGRLRKRNRVDRHDEAAEVPRGVVIRMPAVLRHPPLPDRDLQAAARGREHVADLEHGGPDGPKAIRRVVGLVLHPDHHARAEVRPARPRERGLREELRRAGLRLRLGAAEVDALLRGQQPEHLEVRRRAGAKRVGGEVEALERELEARAVRRGERRERRDGVRRRREGGAAGEDGVLCGRRGRQGGAGIGGGRRGSGSGSGNYRAGRGRLLRGGGGGFEGRVGVGDGGGLDGAEDGVRGCGG
mmetsp:Transcript_1527/g.4207  ORF Transcript_1527/g.4207 Transcript_1527/m.4207 type:complete len:286 (-) Transcript_1527:92-949(-)